MRRVGGGFAVGLAILPPDRAGIRPNREHTGAPLAVPARASMARERPGRTLQATSLVHEAYLRLVGEADPGWNGRGHFFGAEVAHGHAQQAELHLARDDRGAALASAQEAHRILPGRSGDWILVKTRVRVARPHAAAPGAGGE